MSPQILGLLAALLCPLVMFVGLFLVLRTPGLKWRIAWAVLCFIGVGAFWMRTADGAWGFVPAAINILGPTQRAGYFQATLPLGAIAAMFVCVSVRRAQKAAARRAEQASGEGQP